MAGSGGASAGSAAPGRAGRAGQALCRRRRHSAPRRSRPPRAGGRSVTARSGTAAPADRKALQANSQPAAKSSCPPGASVGSLIGEQLLEAVDGPRPQPPGGVGGPGQPAADLVERQAVPVVPKEDL